MNTDCKKILVVFGTRPEALKMVPLVKELIKFKIFNVKVCVTAHKRYVGSSFISFFNKSRF